MPVFLFVRPSKLAFVPLSWSSFKFQLNFRFISLCDINSWLPAPFLFRLFFGYKESTYFASTPVWYPIVFILVRFILLLFSLSRLFFCNLSLLRSQRGSTKAICGGVWRLCTLDFLLRSHLELTRANPIRIECSLKFNLIIPMLSMLFLPPFKHLVVCKFRFHCPSILPL